MKKKEHDSISYVSKWYSNYCHGTVIIIVPGQWLAAADRKKSRLASVKQKSTSLVALMAAMLQVEKERSGQRCDSKS